MLCAGPFTSRGTRNEHTPQAENRPGPGKHGGPLAAVYEIGVLAALEESIEGLDVNDAAIYVGISVGMASSPPPWPTASPRTRCAACSSKAMSRRPTARPCSSPKSCCARLSAELRKRLAMVPGLLLGSLFHYARHRKSVFASFERFKEALLTGILSGDGIGQYLKQTFARAGRSNDFRKLRHKLVIVATDLDTGEAVRFGEPGWDHTPVSKAVQASAAVPGLFPPVEIDGHHFVDGAVRKSMHASIALEHGVDMLFCVNAIVPYNV
ncbi:patatin-like phospholipase family protein [Massilia sp. H-1]|nr:patatin-like phospholipase family protein [Massilia sp. H-1]